MKTAIIKLAAILPLPVLTKSLRRVRASTQIIPFKAPLTSQALFRFCALL